MREIEIGWLSLLTAFRAAREKGVDPKSSPVRVLAARMSELTREFSGDDQAVQAILADAYHAGAGAAYGLDASLMDYIKRASQG